MKIKTLRASGARVTAEVYIGPTDKSIAVTTTIVLDRTSQAVQDAMSTLENFCLREAQDRIGQARNNTEVQARVDALLGRELATRKDDRLKRLKDELDSARETYAQELRDVQRRARWFEDDLRRLLDRGGDPTVVVTEVKSRLERQTERGAKAPAKEGRSA